MTKSNEKFEAYIKFSGPSVNEGEINAGKIGASLVALDKLFKKYTKTIAKDHDKQFEIKIKGLQKGSTNVQVIIEQIIPIAQPLVEGTSWYLIAKAIGITEFGKQFFGTIAQQLVLKMFAKGKRLKEEKRFLEDQIVYIKLINIDGKEKCITLTDWENYKTLYPESKGLVQIDPEETMTIGYKENNEKYDLALISYQEKEYFDSDLEESLEERAKDPFNEKDAEPVSIIGRFIDFYGLAHKYPFAFQARKQQDVFGKQKILCMVNEKDISNIIDYLKPNNSKDLCIAGKATKDFDGKIDKIKIDWFSEDPDFNPEQTAII